jgi:hypothetical protein
MSTYTWKTSSPKAKTGSRDLPEVLCRKRNSVNFTVDRANEEHEYFTALLYVLLQKAFENTVLHDNNDQVLGFYGLT